MSKYGKQVACDKFASKSASPSVSCADKAEFKRLNYWTSWRRQASVAGAFILVTPGGSLLKALRTSRNKSICHVLHARVDHFDKALCSVLRALPPSKTLSSYHDGTVHM